jgi:hypothetical protein
LSRQHRATGRATARAIEKVWRERGVEFEDLAGGGLRASVRALPLDRPAPAESRQHAGCADLGVTSTGPRSPTHRA